MRHLVLAVTGLLLATPAAGQWSGASGLGVNGLLGIGSKDSQLAGVVGLGASADVPWAVLRLMVDLHLTGTNDDDYGWRLTSGGARCYEKGSNADVDDSYCSPDGSVGFSADLSVKVPARPGAAYLGIGLHGGYGSILYATGGYGFNLPNSNLRLLVRGVIGAHLADLQVVASVPVSFGKH